MNDCLVLDSNWMPIELIHWQDAVTNIVTGRAKVVREDEAGRVLRSPRHTISMPRVIVMHNYAKKLRRRVSILPTRANILTRDDHTCQYCGKYFAAKDLTLDHVVPLCQRGQDTWENLVAACRHCNRRKDGRTPAQAGMPLLREPFTPKASDPKYNRKLRMSKLRPEWMDWSDWLPITASLPSALTV